MSYLRCHTRRPYVRPKGELMTEEAMKYGTLCNTEKRTVVDPQGDEHEVTFLASEDEVEE